MRQQVKLREKDFNLKLHGRDLDVKQAETQLELAQIEI